MKTINIGIVEDEEIFVQHLKLYLEQWSDYNKEHCEIHISVFTSGGDLLKADFSKMNIIFMDIGLEQELDGVETAKRLRENHYVHAIVFVTSFDDRIREGYMVDAIDFCPKPITYEDVERCMIRVVKTIASGFHRFKCKGDEEIISIPYNKILYCLSSLHYMEIVTEDAAYRQMISISKIRQILPLQFVQCHRTVIVNMEHVLSLTGSEILISNNKVYPISKTYLSDIQKAYISLMERSDLC